MRSERRVREVLEMHIELVHRRRFRSAVAALEQGREPGRAGRVELFPDDEPRALARGDRPQGLVERRDHRRRLGIRRDRQVALAERHRQPHEQRPQEAEPGEDGARAARERLEPGAGQGEGVDREGAQRGPRDRPLVPIHDDRVAESALRREGPLDRREKPWIHEDGRRDGLDLRPVGRRQIGGTVDDAHSVLHAGGSRQRLRANVRRQLDER